MAFFNLIKRSLIHQHSLAGKAEKRGNREKDTPIRPPGELQGRTSPSYMEMWYRPSTSNNGGNKSKAPCPEIRPRRNPLCRKEQTRPLPSLRWTTRNTDTLPCWLPKTGGLPCTIHQENNLAPQTTKHQGRNQRRTTASNPRPFNTTRRRCRNGRDNPKAVLLSPQPTMCDTRRPFTIRNGD